jgi:hypothetical protein
VFPVKTIPTANRSAAIASFGLFKRAEELSMPIYHNVRMGTGSASADLSARRLCIFAPQEGQMSLVSLITQRLARQVPCCSLFTEAGTSFIKPLVQWLDKVARVRRSITTIRKIRSTRADL